MELKEFRKSIGISIKEASSVVDVPVRTYVRYENNNNYGSPLKRKQILSELQKKYEITEEKGILSIDKIKNIVGEVLSNHADVISFCYLFGSYAKGYATEKSVVDLCISTTITGMDYFGLAEELRTALKKKVDLLRICDLNENIELINEIMKDGIKIYG